MFIQADWLYQTEPGVGTNRYAYSFNDPVNLMDPTGSLTIVLKGKDNLDSQEKFQQGSEFLSAIEATFAEKPVVITGVITSFTESQSAKARELLAFVESYPFGPNESLKMIGFSHRGNVIKE